MQLIIVPTIAILGIKSLPLHGRIEPLQTFGFHISSPMKTKNNGARPDRVAPIDRTTSPLVLVKIMMVTRTETSKLCMTQKMVSKESFFTIFS